VPRKGNLFLGRNGLIHFRGGPSRRFPRGRAGLEEGEGGNPRSSSGARGCNNCELVSHATMYSLADRFVECHNKPSNRSKADVNPPPFTSPLPPSLSPPWHCPCAVEGQRLRGIVDARRAIKSNDSVDQSHSIRVPVLPRVVWCHRHHHHRKDEKEGKGKKKKESLWCLNVSR